MSNRSGAGDRRDIRHNSVWNALQQIANLASGSVFAIALAWVLPLSEYGVYSYAMSLCAIGVAVTSAGLNGLGIKYCVEAGGRGGQAVAAILIIRELFCVATYLVLGAVAFTSDEVPTTVAALVVLSSLFFRAFDAPELWYMAHMRSRRTATIRLAVVAVMLAVRVVSMFLLPHVWMFIGIYIAEVAVMSGWILLRFARDRETPALRRPPGAQVRSMLRESSPLALSGIADQINLRSDVIFIQPILGSAAVGVYALATRVSELAYFLPIVIMNATLPVLLHALQESRDTGSTRYQGILQTAYDRAFQGGVTIALLVTAICLSPVKRLFSADLQPMFDVLLIHIWASPFVFMGAVYSKWIIAEGFLWSSLIRHCAGAVINVGLVLSLIHRWGLPGVAAATVVSYAIANYLAAFLGKRSREQGYCMTRAVFSPISAVAALLLGTGRAGRHRA